VSRSFDGTNDVLSNANGILTAVPITQACWTKRGATGAAHGLMGLFTGTSDNHRFNLQWNASDALVAVTRTTSSGLATTTATVAETTTWHHVAGVFPATNSRSVYLDGANKVTNTTDLTPVGINKFLIGERADGTSDLNGLIAHAAIWNVALDDAEIAMLGTDRVHPLMVRPQSLVAYWQHMGRDTADIDVIGGYNLTASGTTANGDEPPLLWMPSRRVIILPAAVVGGDITAAGSLSISGLAALVATGALLAAGAVSISGAADLKGSGSLEAAGSASITGTADLDAIGQLVAVGSASITGLADLDATGNLLAAGSVAINGAADLTGGAVHDIAAAGSLSITGAADLDATGTLAAAGDLSITGAADLTSSSIHDIAAAGALSITGAADLDATGTLAASGSLAINGAASLVSPTSAEEVAGGFWYAVEAVQARRKKRLQDADEAEAQAQAIKDQLDREIALLLREQERLDGERAERGRLQALAKHYASDRSAELFGERVAKAMTRAAEHGNFSAVEAFMREARRAQEEELFLLRATLLAIELTS